MNLADFEKSQFFKRILIKTIEKQLSLEQSNKNI